MKVNDGEQIFEVSEYISFLNSGLQDYKAKIIGEVSEAKVGPTGHVYFVLKDEKDQSIINCIIWRSKYNIYGIELKEGMKIIASGCPSVYPPSGRLSFIADVIELVGEGALKKEYERLKMQLSKEGLFAESRKRKIPDYPQKIGLITSRQGAVIADFLSNIGKFGFKIKMIDSRVEGQEAVADLLLSIKTLKKQDIDVLVIIRGGGSLESMMAFNNEMIVRAVASFPAPVIVGVGHHKDEPLVTFAADVSVSTPTAVANFLTKSWLDSLLVVERFERNIFDSYEIVLNNANLLISRSIENIKDAGNLIIEKYEALEGKFRISLLNFKNALQNVKISIDSSLGKSISGFNSLLTKIKEKLTYAEKVIDLNNPERQLRLGYSIAISGEKVVKKVDDVKIGEKIDIRVTDGTIGTVANNKQPRRMKCPGLRPKVSEKSKGSSDQQSKLF